MAMLHEAGLGEDKFPVMKAVGRGSAGVAPQERQLQTVCIVDVRSDIQKILTQPPETYLSTENVTCFHEKGNHTDSRHEKLAECASQ